MNILEKVAVGSENPTKIDAAQQAFAIAFPNHKFVFSGIAAPSGVNEQPMSEAESILGANNRAQFVFDNSDADFAIGMEGGMYFVNDMWFVSDWVVVRDRNGEKGIAGTPRYFVPEYLAKHVTADFDLSAVLEEKLNKKDIGKLDGYAGMSTNNHITRTTSNRDALVIALAPFKQDWILE
jgi:inosine/xanthosine triphosphatase